MVTLGLEGPLDTEVPQESLVTLDPEEARVTEETKAQLARAWTGPTETKGCEDHKVCPASAKTAEMGLTASLGSLAILAFLVPSALRGLLASAIPPPAKEP